MNSRKIHEIADLFGVQVRTSKHSANGVYRVELTNGKSYALRSMSYPLSRLRWIDGILLRMRDAGLFRLAWRDPSEPEGKKLYVIHRDGRPYILTPWINGRWPSPHSRQEMMACGALLAEFHKHGTVSPKESRKANMIGKWPEELRQKHAKLEGQVRRARQSRRSDRISLFLRKHGDELLSYSLSAQSMLRNSQYAEACALARKQPTVCHGDGGPTNFILTKDGPYLIDFETMRIDLRAFDLYRVIFNSCWTSGWDFATAKAILDGYQEVSKLNSTDLHLVCAWLRFPRTTALLLQHYRSKYHSSRASIAARLPAAIRTERHLTHFLKELSMYVS